MNDWHTKSWIVTIITTSTLFPVMLNFHRQKHREPKSLPMVPLATRTAPRQNINHLPWRCCTHFTCTTWRCSDFLLNLSFLTCKMVPRHMNSELGQPWPPSWQGALWPCVTHLWHFSLLEAPHPKVCPTSAPFVCSQKQTFLQGPPGAGGMLSSFLLSLPLIWGSRYPSYRKLQTRIA